MDLLRAGVVQSSFLMLGRVCVNVRGGWDFQAVDSRSKGGVQCGLLKM